MIWTHGAWLDILEGFPSDFGPVKIGSNVWLPARGVVLPNVTIGNDVVIGINSTINRSLPDGCLAAGTPCKVIKENVYPQKLDKGETTIMIMDILVDWIKLCQYKEVEVDVSDIKYYSEERKIYLNHDDNETIYDIETRTMEGYVGPISEDLRDYLRRRGIKIYTENRFQSIQPKWRKQ
jgi:hypothetical protein